MQTIRLKNQSQLLLIEELNEKNEDHLIKNYPLHKNWVKKALRDIKIGNRIALGVLDSGTLVGSVIGKFGLSGELELKNLLIDSKVAGERNLDINEIRTKLLDGIDLFCQKNGYDTCMIDVQTDVLEEINYFLKEKFTVSNLKSFRDSNRKSIYSLVKNVRPVYNKDPLDLLKMVQWILHREYEFENLTRDDYTDHIAGGGIVFHRFRFDIRSKLREGQYHLKGEALVDEVADGDYCKEEVNKIKDLFSQGTDFKMIFSARAQSAFDEHSIKSFGYDDIKMLLGGESSVSKIPFSKNDVGGLLVFVDEQLERILEKLDKPNPDLFNRFVVYLAEGYGNSLNEQMPVYFCKVDALNEEDVKLWAFSQIINRYSGTYEDVFKNFREGDLYMKKSWGSPKDTYNKSDWNFYTSSLQNIGSDNGAVSEIAVLLLSPMEKISSQFNIIHNLTNDVRNYIEDELKEIIVETSYIDAVTVQKISEKIDKLPKQMIMQLPDNKEDREKKAGHTFNIGIINGQMNVGDKLEAIQQDVNFYYEGLYRELENNGLEENEIVELKTITKEESKGSTKFKERFEKWQDSIASALLARGIYDHLDKIMETVHHIIK